ncbi:MAG TPA: helicase-related protein, partial [Gemmatimonadaceae bacterium]|nr:helicase-related protein [Gemmatimonadaceae bacterium]
KERYRVGLYHGKMAAADRTDSQNRFMNDELVAIVATNAFGLGIDKPDIRFVVHYHLPGSIEAYYQEAGRAGRDGEPAVCTLMYRVEDKRIQSYFLGGKYPEIDEATKVAIVMEQHPEREPVALNDVADQSGVARRKARIVLTLLKRHGVLREHRGNLWERLKSGLLKVNLSDDLTDYEERRVLDHRKLETMIAYCQTARCYTRFILEYFGETDVAPDWRCHNCGSCDALESWELQHGVAGAVTRLVG